MKPSKLLPCPFWNRKNEPAFNCCLRESACVCGKKISSAFLFFSAGYVVELSKQQKGELVENFHRFNKMRNIFARSARNELKFLPMEVAADKTLSALSTTVPELPDKTLSALSTTVPELP